MSISNILTWIETIPAKQQAPDSDSVSPAKRRRLNPPTPDPSITLNMSGSARREGSPGKREGPAVSDASRSKRSRNLRYEFDLECRSEASATSGRLSPTKQFQYLRLNPSGPDYEDLAQFANKPKALRKLLERMSDVMDGFGIISSLVKPEVLSASSSYDDEFHWAGTRTHFYSDDRDTLGPTPPVKLVLDILDNAAMCNSRHHHEDAWNKQVHSPILQFAFQKEDQRVKDQLITPSSCIHASILPEYQNGTAGTSKKVDFCIHLNPENDTASSAARTKIKHLIGKLPGKVFNFTSFHPLYDRPIALSIETKRPTEGIDVAKLQLGVWQTAHWTFLSTLVHTIQEIRTLKKPHQEQAWDIELDVEVQPSTEALPPGGSDSVVGATETPVSNIEALSPWAVEEQQLRNSKFNLLEFLPGVIVNGHEWWFTVTTFDGSRVKFYEKSALGSTNNTKEIYKLICNLQILRQWIEETYWPWLRDLILECE